MFTIKHVPPHGGGFTGGRNLSSGNVALLIVLPKVRLLAVSKKAFPVAIGTKHLHLREQKRSLRGEARMQVYGPNTPRYSLSSQHASRTVQEE